jgi:hypothetical protein
MGTNVSQKPAAATFSVLLWKLVHIHHQTTRRHIQEESNLYSHGHRKLKSNVVPTNSVQQLITKSWESDTEAHISLGEFVGLL